MNETILDGYKVAYIYRLIDPNDDSVRYVGKAENIDVRYKRHLAEAKSLIHKTHKNYWINKLLKNNQEPRLEVVEECELNVWEEREIYWIKYHKELGCKLTNATSGGDGVSGVDEEHRKAISDRMMGNQYMVGKHHSDETKLKISIANSGENNAWYGKKII